LKRIFCLLILVLTLAGSSPAAARDHAAALLMDAETGQILVSEEIDRIWPPASVVKLMLLLLIDEAITEGRFAPTDTIVATAAAQRQGGSQVYLAAGERATFQKLIEAVAVGSANDAAVAVAVALHGSRAAAIAVMNARAAALGMTNTHYVNVTGLPEGRGKPENKSTALDHALLAREIVNKHPGVLELTKLTWTRFRKGLVLGCTNTLLKEFEGLDGLKTGFHNRSRNNLVATAKRGDRRLIVVVFGCITPDHRDDLATRLLEEGFAGWEKVEVLDAGQLVDAELDVGHSWFARVPVEAGAPLHYLARYGDDALPGIVLMTVPEIIAPVTRGQRIGELQIVLDDRILSRAPAVAARDIGRSWFSLPFAPKQGAKRLVVVPAIPASE
jgi:D-alanyl-D-alanine carboxypeptidase (penicillin-binding protein 5/6)